MKNGIKEKDIRDFEKYANKLNGVLQRIREYKPEANAFLACGVYAYLCLMSEDHCDCPEIEHEKFVVTEVDMPGFDGGDW